MSAVCAATLPHGAVAGTRRRRQATLRLPRGTDEAFLLEEGAGLTTAERVTALLTRCIVEIGGDEPTADDVRGLTVGDREALLLQLRAAALGDRIACLLDCPDCGELLDLDLHVSRLLVGEYPDTRHWHETELGRGRGRRVVRFRLPTGGDQEAAGREEDDELGARVILARCAGDDVPAAAAGSLPSLLAELDPQAEVVVRAGCPACGTEIAAVLDAATILFGELARTADQLFREVHEIAARYHWSEQEILTLDVRRRRRYLALIADAEGL